MNINYEYYRIFYYAAKYKNLTRAAEAIHGSQPNISRALKLLEHNLGCSLITRSNRGISLTPEGERLYAHVRIAVEQLQSAEEEILLSAGLQDGVVTIGASETALHLLLPVLNQFKQKYPGIHIRILNHLTNQAVESIKNGLVDFSVVATHTGIEKPLHSYPIMTNEDILVGGASYAFLGCREHSLQELIQYPLICLGENTITYQFYEEFFRKNGLMLRPEVEAATTDHVFSMIQNNLGIGFLPKIYALEALQKKEVYQIPLSEKIPERQICFIENENYPLSIAAKELKKLLLQYA